MRYLKSFGLVCLVAFSFVLAGFVLIIFPHQIINSLNEVFVEPYYQIDSNTFEMIPPKSIDEEKQITFSKIQFNANLITMVLYPTYHVFMADYLVNEATTADKYLAEGTFINPEDQLQYTIRPTKVNGSKHVNQIQILVGDKVIQLLNKQ